MPRKKLNLGKDAVCSVLMSRLHPQRVLKEKYPNEPPSFRVVDLKVKEQRRERVSGMDQLCVVFHHELLNADVYCVKKKDLMSTMTTCRPQKTCLVPTGIGTLLQRTDRSGDGKVFVSAGRMEAQKRKLASKMLGVMP